MQVIKAAEICLNQDLHMPALILIFTLIDSFAWASSEKLPKQSRKQFEAWVSTWVYPHSPLPCTPTELYAARCGVLHTLTSKADLNVGTEVRQVVYAWGPAEESELKRSIEVLGRPDLVGIHMNALLDAVKEGVARTIEASQEDKNLLFRLEQAASLHFAELPTKSLEQLMALHESTTRNG
jgi:hypothetical protein